MRQDAEHIAEEILLYLQSHPDAADSLEGIVQWWLLRQRYLRGLNQVQTALDSLMHQGLLEKTTNADGTIIYAAAKKLSLDADY